MTTDPTAFNELGQILSMGGEQALARLISAGASEERIVLLFFRRFEPMRDLARTALRDLSDAMVVAGSTIAGLARDLQIPLGIVPSNQFLFGEIPGGRRVRFAVSVEIEELDRFIDLVLDFADMPTVADLLQAARADLQQKIDNSPRAFGFQPGQQATPLNIIIPFAERRF